MLTHINNFSIILLFTQLGFTQQQVSLINPLVPIKQKSFYKQRLKLVFYVCKNYERSCFARKLLKRPINGQKWDYMNGKNWHSLLWEGKHIYLVVFLIKTAPNVMFMKVQHLVTQFLPPSHNSALIWEARQKVAQIFRRMSQVVMRVHKPSSIANTIFCHHLSRATQSVLGQGATLTNRIKTRNCPLLVNHKLLIRPPHKRFNPLEIWIRAHGLMRGGAGSFILCTFWLR